MKRFFDTNVLVYRYAMEAPRKQQIAHGLVHDAIEDGSFLISTQVMIEFRNVAARRLGNTLPMDMVHALLQLWESFDVVPANAAFVIEASERCRRHQLGWWDSLIVTAAVHGGANLLYSEDFQHGRVIDGVRIENPFLTAVHEPRTGYPA